MTQTIYINATKARRNFFQLLDQVLEQDFKVVVDKKDSYETVVIQKVIDSSALEKEEMIARDSAIVKSTRGMLKHIMPYNPNEMNKAKEEFVNKYKKKYNQGLHT